MSRRSSPRQQGGADQRQHPPDFINIKVEEPVSDRPFGNLDDYIIQAELRALPENYKRVAGFSLADVGGGDSRQRDNPSSHEPGPTRR
jgi:5-methylphenazine-1-carboxylate 1-monooxygenase